MAPSHQRAPYTTRNIVVYVLFTACLCCLFYEIPAKHFSHVDCIIKYVTKLSTFQPWEILQFSILNVIIPCIEPSWCHYIISSYRILRPCTNCKSLLIILHLYFPSSGSPSACLWTYNTQCRQPRNIPIQIYTPYNSQPSYFLSKTNAPYSSFHYTSTWNKGTLWTNIGNIASCGFLGPLCLNQDKHLPMTIIEVRPLQSSPSATSISNRTKEPHSQNWSRTWFERRVCSVGSSNRPVMVVLVPGAWQRSVLSLIG